MQVTLASNNKGKLAELSVLLEPLGWDIRAQGTLGISDADETGTTFVENALIKARHACIAVDAPAIADDSGLVVPALGGAPGIYSARYGGVHGDDHGNNALLMENMQAIEDRRAYFFCAMVFLRHAADPVPVIATAAWHGSLTREPMGEHGFGYDPYFWVPQHECTSAQLDPTIKNSLSHRGKATAILLELLQSRLLD